MKCCRLSLKLRILNRKQHMWLLFTQYNTSRVFFQRVVPSCGLHFEKLEVFLAEKLLPTLWFANKRWYLGVLNLTEMCDLYYNVSRNFTDVIVQELKRLQPYTIEDHITAVNNGETDLRKRKGLIFDDVFNDVIETFGLQQQRAIKRVKSVKVSSCLSVLSIKKNDIDLSPVESIDCIAIRYKKPLLYIPHMCDGCGSNFDLSHALSCKKGGLVTRHHNKIRDVISNLSPLVWNKIRIEAIAREADSSDNSPALIADICIHSIWLP